MIRKPIFDSLSTRKETYWLSELVPKLANLGLVCRKLSLSTTGDVDLFIADPKNQFAIAAELKWPVAADRIKKHHVKVMDHGMDQSLKSVG